MNFLDRLRREIAAWGRTEGVRWIFVLKTTIAALLAMAISMRLELGQPVTAMVTVYILMHPQTGMVLTKSIYRICATLAGALASLTLLGLFAQERVLFLTGLALWIGLCTTGATFFRNFKSYAFTLAGYTAAMISLPLIMQPTGFFDYAVNRVTEVVVGIICAGVVSEVIFPLTLGAGIEKTMEARYRQFLGSAGGMLRGIMPPPELDRVHLQLVGSAVTFESQRSSLFMETSETGTRNDRLGCLNKKFMEMSTTLHSLCRHLNRLTKGDAPAAQALTALGESLAELLGSDGQGDGIRENARQTADRLAGFRAGLAAREEKIRLPYREKSDSAVDLDVETALELFDRFVEELHAYSETYASPEEKPGPETPDAVRFEPRTDPALALSTGARAIMVIFLMAAFWIASAWPYGASAVMMAAIGTALFAPAPDPALAIKSGLFGTLIGFAAALACKYLVLTSLSGIGLLVTGIAPFLLVGPYLAFNPKLAMVGLGYSTMFCFTVSPANRMVYDPMQSVNFGSALILGIAAAALVFATFVPVTGGWIKRRTARMLRGQVEIACSCRLSHAGSRFESGTRDLLQRVAARPNLQDVHDREILNWLFVVLEIGRALIRLRQDAASIPLPQQVASGVTDILTRITRAFGRPNAHNLSAAIETVDDTIKTIVSESGREGVGEETLPVLRRMLASLHLIRMSLLDEESILAATTARPPALKAC